MPRPTRIITQPTASGAALASVVSTAIAQDAGRLGADLDEFTRRFLFEPLGMNDSTWNGGAPDKVDDAKARSMPGVIDVVKLPNGVGVLAKEIEQAFAAKNALTVTWTNGPAATYDSEKALDEFMIVARDKTQRGVDYLATGDLDAGMKKSAKIMRATARLRRRSD